MNTGYTCECNDFVGSSANTQRTIKAIAALAFLFGYGKAECKWGSGIAAVAYPEEVFRESVSMRQFASLGNKRWAQ